jgi:hypothetical protein
LKKGVKPEWGLCTIFEIPHHSLGRSMMSDDVLMKNA